MTNLTSLVISYNEGGEDLTRVVIDIPPYDGDRFFSLGTEQDLVLPNGEVIQIYAEVNPIAAPADILVSIIQDGRSLDVRCGAGVIISYQTTAGFEFLAQIGTGAWE
ncbi:hypothetical protein GCM10011613_32890 [Cellvibrio zantedeschiae]|uniref:Uncharacterized protein n=1 Tax=Cellvibrio zantedeschiae TaxID=1237077 RepID=A0ABQ3B9U4_9GAMM|nr:hypothetical protein [Cellvibrio zantedeschiae]GGY85197.1 hypothetical protein GCM10011613_32890 [Cellvibrio zantedeschiae]